MKLVGWLRRHDRGFAALRRAGRVAIIMPLLFAFGVEVLENAAVATFAAFGSFAMLLLVDFGGPMADRLRNQAALAVACGGLIALATLVSRSAWPAAALTGVVGFGILFAGVASSVLASATQPLLLSFILSVCLPGPASTIPDRLMGWGLASACSLVAIALLWPAPARDPVRSAAIAAVRALARRLRDDGDAGAAARAGEALAGLEATFYATPFRPTGLSTAARSVIRLVDELRWLGAIAAQPVADDPAEARAEPLVAAVARVLDTSAALLDDPDADRGALGAAREALHAELAELERSVTVSLLGRPVVSATSPGFRAQEMAYITLQLAANAEAAVAAERRRWADRVLGRRRPGVPAPLSAAQERTGAHLTRQSVWLRNSVRGGLGLAAAVLVAELSSTQHAFWVVLGALSVLRSNALTTGQTIVRAIGGTAVGLVVGGTVVAAIGTDRALLWVLLPVAILAAGLAPTAVSFAAGQAAFTLTVLIIFNILEPAGWSLGLVRFEDVALGCGVSLLVGVLLWPRGAGAVLGRALSDAYRDSAAYLSAAIAYGVARCDARVVNPSRPDGEAARAAAASRRLDDAFRGYLGERGDKPVPMADVTRLVTGVVGLRLAADAVLDLWASDGAHQADRTAVRNELDTASGRMADWYDALATSLQHGGDVPAPSDSDASADGRLVDAAQRDLRSGDPAVAATAVRVLWTGDHLDAARRLEAAVAEPARLFAETVA